jgi:hypothetical protein
MRVYNKCFYYTFIYKLQAFIQILRGRKVDLIGGIGVFQPIETKKQSFTGNPEPVLLIIRSMKAVLTKQVEKL